MPGVKSPDLPNTRAATTDIEAFAQGVLAALGAPATASNIQFIENWAGREGTSARYNPLATTQHANGSYALSGNSAGVQQYRSMADGIAATAKTLQNGHYGDILAALNTGTASEANASGHLANGLKTWSGGGYTQVGTTVGNVSTNGSPTADTPVDLKSFAAAAGIPPQWVNDPELGPLIDEWFNHKLPDAQFYAAAEKTTLWKTTPQSARIAMANQATDPATLHQTIAQLALQIHNQALQAGITLTPAQEVSIATQANTQGWNGQQLTANLATYFNPKGAEFGQAATDANTLRSMYKAYALPIDDNTINQQLQQILSGTQTVQGIQSAAVQKAQTLYAGNPQLSKFISEEPGHTVADWAQPYMAHAATTLGLNPNAIDLSQPMWQKVLSPTMDPNTGASLNQAMTLDQWDRTLRTDPTYGFDNTDNAKTTAAQFSQQLVQKLTGASL